MGVYIAHIILPEVFTQRFYELIPKQRSLVNKLLEQRVILSYSLDMDRKNVWAFIEAENELKVMDVLSSFPIIKDVKVTIQELAFLDIAPTHLPELILN